MLKHRPLKKIVVPTDASAWSERAIPYAVDFARIGEGEVILLHIFTPPMHEFVDSLAIAGEGDSFIAYPFSSTISSKGGHRIRTISMIAFTAPCAARCSSGGKHSCRNSVSSSRSVLPSG